MRACQASAQGLRTHGQQLRGPGAVAARQVHYACELRLQLQGRHTEEWRDRIVSVKQTTDPNALTSSFPQYVVGQQDMGLRFFFVTPIPVYRTLPCLPIQIVAPGTPEKGALLAACCFDLCCCHLCCCHLHQSLTWNLPWVSSSSSEPPSLLPVDQCLQSHYYYCYWQRCRAVVADAPPPGSPWMQWCQFAGPAMTGSSPQPAESGKGRIKQE